MRQNINRSSKPSLIKQIQIFKNYSEHRQRINQSRYRSITSLKKSMSFDKQKLTLHDYIKQRRQYTSDFKRRQALKKSESNDAKMLRKIMEYENKSYGFSLGPGSISNNLLHHNAIVSSYRKTEKIDQQNQQIHFRITRAKSLYNHRPTNSKLVFSNNYSQSITNNLDFKDKDLKKCRVLTEGQEINCDDIDEDVKNFTNYSDIENSRGLPLSKSKLNPQMENSNQPDSNCFKKSNRWNINFKGELTHKKIRNRVCDRIRREKLAQKLYQKKKIIFNQMASKLKIKS